MRLASWAAAVLLVMLLGSCVGTEPVRIGPEPTPEPEEILTIARVLADPQAYEGREVRVLGMLDAGPKGGYLRIGEVEDYPPSPKDSAFMQLTLGELPETTHACLVSLEGPGGIVNREAGAVYVTAVVRNDQEQLFGPKPGWSTQLEAPVITCPTG